MDGSLALRVVQTDTFALVLSLAHDVSADSVVGASHPAGPLVLPGDAEGSAVYELLRDGVMPPVGVQVPDSASIERLRVWIEGLG